MAICIRNFLLIQLWLDALCVGFRQLQAGTFQPFRHQCGIRLPKHIFVFSGTGGRGVSTGNSFRPVGVLILVDRPHLFADRACVSIVPDGGFYRTAGAGVATCCVTILEFECSRAGFSAGSLGRNAWGTLRGCLWGVWPRGGCRNYVPGAGAPIKKAQCFHTLLQLATDPGFGIGDDQVDSFRLRVAHDCFCCGIHFKTAG